MGSGFLKSKSEHERTFIGMEEMNRPVEEEQQKPERFRARKAAYRLIFGRTILMLILLLVQILVLIYVFRSTGRVVTIISSVLSFAMIIVIINRNGQDAYKITWVLILAILPVFGGLFYIFFELQPAMQDIRKRLNKANEEAKPFLIQNPGVIGDRDHENDDMIGICSYLADQGFPTWRNTSTRYFSTGEQYYEELLKQLALARKYIFIEYFIVNEGEMLDGVLNILSRKAAEGVEIRFLYDGMSQFLKLPAGYTRILEGIGVHTRIYAPIHPVLTGMQNYRDHRKIVVIDGETAFTGGINLADEYINKKARFGHWKDQGIRIQGEAVRNFTMAFLQMWNIAEKGQPENYRPYLNPPLPVMEADGYVVPYTDDPFNDEDVGEHVYLDILYKARKYVHIMTPYLVIGSEMVQALTFAAKRGVDVELIIPHIPDKKYAFLVARTYYRVLLEAGVKVYEYTPGFIHSKSFVSDDRKAVVGSINLDYRSLYLHFEDAVLFFYTDTVLDAEKDFIETRGLSQEITMEDYQKISRVSILTGRILRLFAPLL